MNRIPAATRAPCLPPAFWVSLAMLASGAMLSGCSKAPAAARSQAAPVKVATVVEKTVPIQVKTFGSVEPKASVSVKAQVGGELTSIGFTDGMDVKEGQPIFTLDARPLQAALMQAQAAVKQAEATQARDIALMKNAQTEAARAEALVKEGAYTKEQRDNAVSSAAAADAAVRADEAAVRAAEAVVDNAQVQLGYCTIRSPITGRIGMRLVDVGNLIKANDVPLAVINQVRPIYVGFSIPEQQLPILKKYMAPDKKLKVQAFIPGSDERPATGELTFVDNAIDSATGTIRLRGTFPNEDGRLWPGQYVNVVLTLASQPTVLVVPAIAVQTGQQGKYVFVVKSDQTVEKRPVVAGEPLDDETAVEKGLNADETVVTDGQLRLASGSKVEVAKPPMAKQSPEAEEKRAAKEAVPAKEKSGG